MSVTSIRNNWLPFVYGGDDGADRTVEVNVPRQAAMVQVSIFEASGGGLIYAGIFAPFDTDRTLLVQTYRWILGLTGTVGHLLFSWPT